VRIGIYGGSFDPIHRGHLEPVHAARAQLGLDRVIYVPTALPPHKEGRQLAPPLARWAMVELALLDDPDAVASPLELTGEPSYTVDTVGRLQALHPGARLFLLLGADAFLELPTWRRWRELAAQAVLAVLRRAGWEGPAFDARLSPDLRALLDAGGAVLLSNPLVPTTATELRARLARGERPSPEELPARVLQYIEKYGLYR
jgi:nicotinate-nucleotide adenylyltransferase